MIRNKPTDTAKPSHTPPTGAPRPDPAVHQTEQASQPTPEPPSKPEPSPDSFQAKPTAPQTNNQRAAKEGKSSDSAKRYRKQQSEPTKQPSTTRSAPTTSVTDPTKLAETFVRRACKNPAEAHLLFQWSAKIPGFTQAAAKVYQTLSPTDKQAFLSSVIGGLRTDNKKQAVALLQIGAKDLSATQIRTLCQSAIRADGENTQLNGILTSAFQGASTESKLEIAKWFLTGLGRLPKGEMLGLYQSIASFIARSGENTLKQVALERLGPVPFQQHEMQAHNKAWLLALQTKLKNAPKNSLLWQYRRLLRATQLAASPAWKGKINIAQLNQRMQELQKQPAFQQAIRDLQQQASKTHFKDCTVSLTLQNAKTMVEAQSRYLLGESFGTRLALVAPEQRTNFIKQEFAKLVRLGADTTTLHQVRTRLLGQQTFKNRSQILKALPSAKRESAFKTALLKAGANAGDAANMAKTFSDIFDKLKLDPLQEPGKIEKQLAMILTKFKDNPRYSKIVDFLNKANNTGALGGIIALASLVGVFEKGLPKDLDSFLGSSAQVLSLLGNAEDAGKLLAKAFRASEETLQVGRAGQFFRFAKFLGPIGDGLSTIANTRGFFKELDDQDYFGASMKGVIAVTSGVSVVAGTMVAVASSTAAASPSTGPGAPLVLTVAMVVGLGAATLDACFGETDDATLLRQMGLLHAT